MTSSRWAKNIHFKSLAEVHTFLISFKHDAELVYLFDVQKKNLAVGNFVVTDLFFPENNLYEPWKSKDFG